MRSHLELFGQILFAAVLTVAGVGPVAASLFPYWLAVYLAPCFAAVFFAGAIVLVAIVLLWCGMLLQRREDDARMVGLLKRAGL